MNEPENYWWYITLHSASSDEETLNAAAEMSGGIGAELQDLPHGARLRIYYRANRDVSHWRGRLLDVLAEHPDIKIEDMGKIDNQQWNVRIEEAFPPLPVGKNLVVLAPWHRGSEPAKRIPIYINPGSAFGTGYHESTQVGLELLEKYLSKGGRVIDVGVGSGILTIAAARLGASSVLARDIDPAVLSEAENNIALNDIDKSLIRVEEGDLLSDVTGPFDVMTANILLEPLINMLPDVGRVMAPGGTAIFSGMTLNERERFLRILGDIGMSVREELSKEEWWGVAAENPA